MSANPLFAKTAPLGTVIAFLFGLLAVASLAPGHLAAALVVALILAGGAYFYLYQVDIAVAKWRPEDWQRQIQVRHSEVSPRDVNRVRRYFIEGEEEILWISHRHIIHLILRIWLPSLLALAFLAVALVVGTVRIPVPQHSNTAAELRHALTTQTTVKLPAKPTARPKTRPKQVNIKKPAWLHWPKAIVFPAWLWLIPAGLLGLFVLLIWAAWASWFFIVTNRRVIVMERPFPVLPFNNGDANPFFLSDLKNAEISGSLFRMRWGLAVMDVSSYLQPEEDAAIKDVWGLPHVEDVAELINQLVQANKSTMEGVPDPVFGDLTDEVRKLRLAVEPLSRRFGIAKPPDEWPTQEM